MRIRSLSAAARRAVLGGAAFIAALGHMAPAEARHAYPFVVAWGEVTLFTGEIVFDDGDGAYAIEGRGETQGPLDLMYSWSLEVAVNGALGDDGRHPETYQTAASWSEGESRTRLTWRDDGPPIAEIERTAPPRERTPVDPDLIGNAVDSLTFFARVADQLRETSGRSCDLTGRVWDGVRLFEITSRTLGAGDSPADRPWSYVGPTMRCQLIFQRLGGFNVEPTRYRAPETETMRVLHFAWLGEGWRPVRLEVDSPVGSIVARLRVDVQRAAD